MSGFSSLDRTLQDLAPVLPGALISGESLSRMAQAVRGLPAAVTPHLGFECPLGVAQPVGDFGFLVDSRHGGHSILAGLAPRHPLPQRFSADRVWQRLSRLCRLWCEHESDVAREIQELWLEFDVLDAPAPESVVPSLFVRRAPAADMDAQRRGLRLERVLASLMDTPLSPAAHNALAACLSGTAFPDDVTYVGVMLSRASGALRLCIRGLLPEQLPSFLSRIGWRGSPDEAGRALVPFAQLADRFTLAIDVGDTIGPRVGLECRLDREVASAWGRFMDRLVAQGACTGAKRDAVLQWTGWTMPVDETQIPSGHAAERMWLHGLKAVPLLVPTIMHMKVSYRPAMPIEAKAYMGAGLRWRLAPDVAAGTASLQGAFSHVNDCDMLHQLR